MMTKWKLKGGRGKKKRESEFLTLFRVFRVKKLALHTVQQTKVKHAENKFEENAEWAAEWRRKIITRTKEEHK